MDDANPYASAAPDYFVQARSLSHATDETWPSCYPFAVVAKVTGWRVALFACPGNAHAFCHLRVEMNKLARTDADVAADPRA
jgi:hypothetical protein